MHCTVIDGGEAWKDFQWLNTFLSAMCSEIRNELLLAVCEACGKVFSAFTAYMHPIILGYGYKHVECDAGSSANVKYISHLFKKGKSVHKPSGERIDVV